MPYISSNDDRREKLRNGEPAQSAGELNYQIFYYTKINSKYPMNIIKIRKDISKFILQFLGKNRNYQKYNDMTGALVRCSKEIIRRQVHRGFENFWAEMLIKEMEYYDNEIASYEDLKIKENFDVE